MSARAILLTAGAFVVGTSAYIVSGVLPEISAETGATPAAVGQLATAFSLAYAVGAPLVATLAGRWDRRTLLVAALLAAAAGNALTALAPTYPLLFVGRIVAALGAAAYTPAATLVATSFYPPERRGRAVAIVFGGLTLALALGVPAGSFLGEPLGFRGVFLLVAAAGLASAVGVRLLVPSVPAPPPVTLTERFSVLRERTVQVVLAVTVLGVLGTMSVYVYVVPLLAEFTGATGPVVSILLLVYGLGAIVGNTLGGRATDRFGPRRTLIVVMTVTIAAVATLPFTLLTVAGAATALVAWSLASWAFNPPFQSLILDVAGEQSALVLSLNASAIYLGAGLSGMVGGLVVAGPGVQLLPPVGAALALLGMGVLLVGVRSRTPTAEPAPATGTG
ncbi:Predicted arabinose efflux permease, MFS family [Pseudonocardia thermophila]|uniref:Predicted arabinose efflux permease, MFS family n=1 Tax=Pseudonocardia thermophila TaxID=1848 RepID=A0A1M7B741_PSETH|nr:MFS transporter [Pseudonocardia thermophila]SHL50696.1 Predicted arabinose efflux permease, MFS family [Pseudonocardia thermophila]